MDISCLHFITGILDCAVRNGTCCVLVAIDPHEGKRLLRVMKHRTRVDYAHFMKELVQQYPDAESIRLVQDNL